MMLPVELQLDSEHWWMWWRRDVTSWDEHEAWTEPQTDGPTQSETAGWLTRHDEHSETLKHANVFLGPGPVQHRTTASGPHETYPLQTLTLERDIKKRTRLFQRTGSRLRTVVLEQVSYVCAHSPSGPRSQTRPGRWPWWSPGTECRGPVPPGRRRSRHCSGSPGDGSKEVFTSRKQSPQCFHPNTNFLKCLFILFVSYF